MTLVELLLALSVTAVVGAAIAAMLHGAAYGTRETGDLRDAMVRQRATAVRLAAAFRGSRAVLACDGGAIVLWIDDRPGPAGAEPDGLVDVDELRRVERVGDELRSYRAPAADPSGDFDPAATDFLAATAALIASGDLAPSVWVTGVTDWRVAADSADPAAARLVRFSLSLRPPGGGAGDGLIGAAALRNAP